MTRLTSLPPALLSRIVPSSLAVCLSIGVSLGLSSGAAAARDMVSVKSATANMRSGPGTRHAVEWSLQGGYPLQVVTRKGQWVKVSDYEKDVGWIHGSLLGKQPHHIVKSAVANIRQRPSTRSPIVGRLQRGEVVRTIARQPGWVQVAGDGAKGWVATSLLWGW